MRRRPGRRPIPDEDLAFAYELRQEGRTWKAIGIGRGHNWKTLKRRIEERTK